MRKEHLLRLSRLPHKKIVAESQIELKPEDVALLPAFFEALASGTPWEEVEEMFPMWIEPYYDVMTEKERERVKKLINQY